MTTTGSFAIGDIIVGVSHRDANGDQTGCELLSPGTDFSFASGVSSAAESTSLEAAGPGGWSATPTLTLTLTKGSSNYQCNVYNVQNYFNHSGPYGGLDCDPSANATIINYDCGASLDGTSSLYRVFSIRAKVTTDDTSGSHDYLNEGVMGIYQDGTTKRLGICTDPAFNTGGSGTLSLNVGGAVTSPNSVSVDLMSDSFTKFDGDINADGIVNWNDRKAFMACLGAHFGDSNYNARADFNLDGVIDAADVTAFNQLGCTANVDNSTTNPVLNAGDYTAFLTAFRNGDAAANCDGSTTPPVLTVADFTCFFNVRSHGCTYPN
jgi:hypothetical protein